MAERNRWERLLLVVTSFLTGFIVRFAWPPLAPVAVSDLGMDMSQAGSFISAFYIGYVIIQIPAGILGDRFGVRKLIVMALGIQGLATIAMGFATGSLDGFLLRFLAGLGAGILFSSCIRCISDWFEPRERGLAFGIMMIAPTGGGVLLPNLIMPSMAEIWGWRGAFIAVGIFALVLAVLLFLRLPGDEKKTGGSRDFFTGLKFVLSKRDLMLIALAGWGIMWGMISFIAWTNSYVKSLGYSLGEASLVMGLFGIGGIIAPLLAGWIIDRTGRPKAIMIVGCIVLIPLVGIFGMMTSLNMLMLLGIVAGVFFGLINPPLTLLVPTYAGKEWAATAGGVAGCIFQIGSILGPSVIGLVYGFCNSYQWVFWIMSAGLLVTIGALLMTGKAE